MDYQPVIPELWYLTSNSRATSTATCWDSLSNTSVQRRNFSSSRLKTANLC